MYPHPLLGDTELLRSVTLTATIPVTVLECCLVAPAGLQVTLAVVSASTCTWGSPACALHLPTILARADLDARVCTNLTLFFGISWLLCASFSLATQWEIRVK